MNQVAGNAAAGITAHPDTTMFEPGGAAGTATMNMFDNTLNIPIERIIWLGQKAPPAALRTSTAFGLYYANHNGNGSSLNQPILVAPDNYAVIGPRANTAIGATNSQTPWGAPSPQTITLGAGVTVTTPAGGQNNPNAADIKQPTTVTAAADLPTTWNTTTGTQATVGIGMSISEPLPNAANYYPQPTVQNPAAAPYNLFDAYGDLNQANPQVVLGPAAGCRYHPGSPVAKGWPDRDRHHARLQDGLPATACRSDDAFQCAERSLQCRGRV